MPKKAKTPQQNNVKAAPDATSDVPAPPQKDTVKDETAEVTTPTADKTCVDCRTDWSPLWRVWKEDKQLLCTVCHTKRVKQAVANQSKSAAKSKSAEAVRSSNRKNKTKKKLAGCSSVQPKSYQHKSRRTLFKAKPAKSPAEVATVMTTNSTYHNGLLLQVGDVVCAGDVDGGTYYAQLRGFLQDDYCNKSAVVTWLVPTLPGLTRFEPSLFVPGPAEEVCRSLDCFSFVCRAPSNLFKTRTTDSRFYRSQSDLSSLLLAAQTARDTSLVV